MRIHVLCGAICAGIWLILAPARAFEIDVHHAATLAIALAIGFDWDEANLIANSDQAVDENVDTWPTEHIAFGKALEGSTQEEQLELQNLSLGLSPQDYFFHCFSRTHDPDGINEDVRRHLTERERDLFALIGKANTKLDRQKILIGIGVYLHCQQDSWSHNEFGGIPTGHVWASLNGANPDHPAMRPLKTDHALRETRDKLAAFASAMLDSATLVNDKDLDELIKGFTNEKSKAFDVSNAERIVCNDHIARHWVAIFATTHPVSSINRVARSRHEEVVIRPITWMIVPDPPDMPRPKNLPRPRTQERDPDLVSFGCEYIFKDAFEDVASRFSYEDLLNGKYRMDWKNPVDVSFIGHIEIISYPKLAVSIGLMQPEINSMTGEPITIGKGLNWESIYSPPPHRWILHINIPPLWQLVIAGAYVGTMIVSVFRIFFLFGVDRSRSLLALLFVLLPIFNIFVVPMLFRTAAPPVPRGDG